MKNNFEELRNKLAQNNESIILDIGCGKVKRGTIGLDSYDGEFVDIVANVEEKLPIPDASCDEVKMFHVLEHVRDPLALLSEVRRILKPGGITEIRVPHFTNITAYQIHHRSYWNSFSLDPILSVGSKSNESIVLFTLVEKRINLMFLGRFSPLITRHAYLYELFLCKLFPGYEIVFILKK
jgi:ubiquinone/menaquinone biosynthesis C-methylase UbiE